MSLHCTVVCGVPSEARRWAVPETRQAGGPTPQQLGTRSVGVMRMNEWSLGASGCSRQLGRWSEVVRTLQHFACA